MDIDLKVQIERQPDYTTCGPTALHALYSFYGDPIDNPGMKDGFDLMRPLLENACGRSPLPCHFLDLRPIFDGHPEYVDVDGFVFTPDGATAAARATFELMQARCVAN